MSDEIDLRVLELLCGRLCHELISPVGAINNGVELLDEDDPDFVKEAMGLIGQSAKKAGQRLQFYRFAYGTASASVNVSGSALDLREIAQGLVEGGKITCEWSAAVGNLAAPLQRLACNMYLVGVEALPRGGTVGVTVEGGAVAVAAQGDAVNASDELKAALSPSAVVDNLTARTIHAYYTARLAERAGVRLTLSLAAPNRLLLVAKN